VPRRWHPATCLSGKGKAAGKDKTAARSKRIQETLKEFEEAEKKRRKRLTLRQLINQAGLELDIKVFVIASIVVGAVLFLLTLVIAGVPFYVAAVAGVVGALGLPRWFINYLAKRRREKFLHDFADAIDVMVRGIKAGLASHRRLEGDRTRDPCAGRA
jgi:tight adherence protein B